jgi:hypothetical protein
MRYLLFLAFVLLRSADHLEAVAILGPDLCKTCPSKNDKSAQKVFIPSKMLNPYLSSFLSLKQLCFQFKIFVTNQSAGFSGFTMNRDRRAGTVVKVAD